MPAFASTEAALQALVPELYALGSTAYQVWLDWAAEQECTAAQGWGTNYYAAIALRAGHQWWRLTRGGLGQTIDTVGQTGGFASRGAGGQSESYTPLFSGVIITPEEADLLTTTYGTQYNAMRRRTPKFGSRIVRV
jgi:hypothetical protein